MKIRVLQVPYDSGRREERQGNGPKRFIEKGLARVLEDDGHQVEVDRIDADTPYKTEITTAFELNRALSIKAKAAVAQGCFPLVLAGNCNACLGTLGGIGSTRQGVVWFDAHGEFNTPETTLSGFLDGMPLAMATGRCWRSLLKTIPGFEPVPDARIVLVGAIDLDRAEEEAFVKSAIRVVPPSAVEANGADGFEKCLLNLKQQVDSVYLHIDMDILDFGDVYANHLEISGNVQPDTLKKAISMIKAHFTIAACTLASYDPAGDPDGVVAEVGVGLMRYVVL
jgi:arginase